jgi:hypothetical protein
MSPWKWVYCVQDFSSDVILSKTEPSAPRFLDYHGFNSASRSTIARGGEERTKTASIAIMIEGTLFFHGSFDMREK